MKTHLIIYLIVGFVIINANALLEFKVKAERRTNPEENSNLFQGDMIFPDDSSEDVLKGESSAWPNGIVPYQIASEFSSASEQVIISTMRKMENLLAVNKKKCIQFQPKTSSDAIYITIRNRHGCSSHVGRGIGDYERIVSLEDPHCIHEGRIMHQLLHVLGFHHEQSRSDRDRYVKIHWKNIQPEHKKNFGKYDTITVSTQNTSYDYGSIMHYDTYAFSNSNQRIIEPLKAGIQIGQRDTLSAIDIQEVRAYYQCSASSDTINWNGKNWAIGCDFPGNDLSDFRIRVEDCGEKCVSTAGCTHFVWTKKNGGTCWLKKGNISKDDALITNDRRKICGTVETKQKPTINWNETNWAFGCDFYNNDFFHTLSRDEDCRRRCVSTPDCTHFAWTTYNGGTCYMKKGSVSKADAIVTQDQSMICGVVEPEEKRLINWNGNNWAFGCDFYNNDLSHILIRGEDCGGTCASTRGCTHFTWTTYNGGTCFMKKGRVSKNDAMSTQDQSMVCGILGPGETRSINWNGNNWAFGCDFYNNDLSHILSRGEDCGGTCASTPECTHFTWTTYNGGTCYMKSGLVSKGDAMSTQDRSMVCGVLGTEEKHSISWNGNNWAFGCNFPGNDLSKIEIRGEDCGGRCASTDECTHFVWTRKNDGTCYMKKGPISKNDALPNNDRTMVCGVNE